MGHVMDQEQNGSLKSMSRARKHRIRAPTCITFINAVKTRFVFLFQNQAGVARLWVMLWFKSKTGDLNRCIVPENIGLEPQHASHLSMR